ncbi:transmembrane protein [Thalictrum thalictroides]|uniref:Transmembrane protein n=1 Tax=Thalictrum thalictroides TaxID=46969 RepID=A0A7J6VMI1_THATH|nr:transmembrane protein [Thalictrum thalictroides]
MEILREVCKLPHKNKKIFFFIFLSTFIPYILLLIGTMYAFTSISTDLSMNAIPLMSMNPASPDYFKQLFKVQQDGVVFFLIEVVVFLLSSVITVFSMMTTIYVSTMSYLGRDLKLKDLFMKIKKIWIRPVVTWFYAILMNTGLCMLVLPLIFLIILSKGSSVFVLTIGIILVLLATCLYMYLNLVSMLSIVTSILEDSYGLQAIGKGAELIKGRKLVGFVLNFIWMILIGLNMIVSMMNMMKIQGVALMLLISFCTVIFGTLVTILSMMMYTVFYFDCKHSHGEEVEVEENTGYTKVSTIPLVDSALP